MPQVSNPHPNHYPKPNPNPNPNPNPDPNPNPNPNPNQAKTPYLPPAEAEPLAQLGPCRYRLAKAAELDAKYNLSSLVNLHAAEGAAPGSTALAAAGSSALGGDEPEPRP